MDTFVGGQSAELITLAEKIVNGEACEIPFDMEDSVALDNLRAAVRKRNSEILDEQVALSVSINETAVFAVTLASDLSDVAIESDSIASASVELEATVKDLNTHANGVLERAEIASGAANSCVNSMRETTSAMQDIDSSVEGARQRVGELAGFSKELGKITKTIREIAAQTNLLALNATIEAARAGEAGKGFAVVANEVKALSGQTAAETVVIEQLLESIQNEIVLVSNAMEQSAQAVGRGNEAVDAVGNFIQELDESTQSTHSSMQQVADVLASQSQAIAEISGNVTEVSKKADRCGVSVGKIVDAAAQGDGIIMPFLTDLASKDIPGKVVKLAKSDHVIWKKRLYAMLVGREGLRAEELADCHSCRLGKWFDGVDAEYSSKYASFRDLRDPHRLVHEHGIAAVKHYNSGRLNEAIGEVAQVEAASQDVLRLLAQLEGEMR